MPKTRKALRLTKDGELSGGLARMCFIRQGSYVDFGKKASYSCVTRRMPNIRRRQKPRNPELFITTIFMATILSSCTGSATAEQSESQRDNNHRREKQYQLNGTESRHRQPQPEGDSVHPLTPGQPATGFGTTVFPQRNRPLSLRFVPLYTLPGKSVTGESRLVIRCRFVYDRTNKSI